MYRQAPNYGYHSASQELFIMHAQLLPEVISKEHTGFYFKKRCNIIES